jgi:hypothetical protein
MDRLLCAASVVVVALGARDFSRFLRRKRKAEQFKQRLDLWEGEGGAVPTSSRRTAAQVSPRAASPSADG